MSEGAHSKTIGIRLKVMVTRYFPGVMMALTLAMAATFISDHYGAPVMLMALLLGMSFNFLSEEGRCVEGVQFSSSRLLKVGVALLGFRVSVSDLLSLGMVPLVIVPTLVLATIGSGVLIARILGKSTAFGLLTGGAVAICGASAALALSVVLPKNDEVERDTLFTVVAVTSLSTLAMIGYPILFTGLGFADSQVGFLIGATIHDVAQVVGAGYAVSEDAGNTATYVKMLRVAMLPLVVGALALFSRRSLVKEQGHVTVPWFAVWFGIFLIINSLGVIPAVIVASIASASQWLLVLAIAALGMKTSLQSMVSSGRTCMAVIVTQTFFLLLVAVAAVWFFIPRAI